MDKQRAKIIIKKINSLFDSIEMEHNEVSAIERDLMLKYIRDLYEIFVDGPTQPSFTKKTPARTVPPPKAEPENKLKPVINPEPMEQPTFDQQKTEKPIAEPGPEPVSPEVKPEPVHLSPKTSASGVSREIEGLFTFQQAKELSEKLSEQPIRDLQAALSINDKLLYTNELFGRQHGVLNDSLSTLNRFDDMEQAKGFLVSLAEQYSWTDAEREEIARSFIKTIRRRYI